MTAPGASRHTATSPIVVIAGPTGSGKSALAFGAAQSLGGEIVGCDSVQIYRGFDIGSAKSSAAERALVPHHLLDALDASAPCDAAVYAGLARDAIAAIQARGNVPIVVGGTGLYLRALLGGAFHADLPKDEALRGELRNASDGELHARLAAVDPRRAAAIHPHDRVRLVRALELVTLLGGPVSDLPPPPAPTVAAVTIILEPDRAALHAAIARRTVAMLAAGLVAEVEALLAAGVSRAAKPMQSIGYKQVLLYGDGALTGAALPEAIMAATRQYAKRQTTWFKKVPAAARLREWRAADVLSDLRQALGR